MSSHPFLELLDSSLSALGDPLAVRLAGQWSSAARRTYESAEASRAPVGRLADVVDIRWQGDLVADERIGAVTFLLATGSLHWAKSPQVSSALAVDVSLHAYADFQPNLATLTAGVGGSWMPGVPIPVGGTLAGACRVEEGLLRTGRVTCLARAEAAAVFVLLIPGSLLQVGRKRIWRIREGTPFAAHPQVAELLTHGRTGTMPNPPQAEPL